jgi:PRTRC genetic system ThiF family protein
MKHYLDPYLMAPVHPVTITVIGCGGTGSYVTTQLAKMAVALRELKDIELFVTVIDDDKVEEHNIGRQLFSPSDIGHFKANVIVNRINRFYGLDWTTKVERVSECVDSNIVITCVDNVATRELIAANHNSKRDDHEKRFYWLDFGNSKDYGQYILSTLTDINQPPTLDEEPVAKLPNMFDLYGEVPEKPNEPSCIMAQSLEEQDLFINLQLATTGISLLWKLFKEGFIEYHGQFLNITTGNTSPLKL